VCCCAVAVGFFADTQGSFADTQGCFAGTQGSFVDALGGKTAVSRYSQKIHWLWGTLTYSFVNTNTSTNQMSPIYPQII